MARKKRHKANCTGVFVVRSESYAHEVRTKEEFLIFHGAGLLVCIKLSSSIQWPVHLNRDYLLYFFHHFQASLSTSSKSCRLYL